MPEWLQSMLPEGWTALDLAVGTVVFAAVSALASIVIIGYILSQLPPDYFVNPAARACPQRHPVLKVLFTIVRNVAGCGLIVLGAILSLPGVPGQGILTILMGVMLVDFPGKNSAERWLLTRRGVLTGVNKLRSRLGKPPLLAEVSAPTGMS